MGRLLSPTRSRIRTVLSSIRNVTAGRWWYKVGFSLLGICLIAAARFDSVSEARAAIRHYATHARAALLMTASETTVVFGPKQFVTAKNNPKGNPQINFVESFSVPSATATNATATEYIIRLQHVGGNLTTATVAVNGTPVAVAADFASATIIERLITVTQTAPNTNSLTLSLKGAEGAGLVVTILGTPNTSFDVFGPKVYEKTAKHKGHEKPDDPKGHEKPDDPKDHEKRGTNPAHFEDSFTLPAGAVAPYRILATASAPGTRSNITLNGVKVIADGDFDPPNTPGITTPVIRDANLVSGNNTLVVDVHGPNGTTITVEVTATDKGAPVLTIASPQANLVTNATTVAVTGTSEDTGPTTVKVNGVAATMNGTQFSATVPLTEGTNTISIVAKDLAGNHTDSTRTVVQDTEAPTLTLTTPADNSFTNQSAMMVLGSVSGGGTITVEVNGVPFPVGPDGTFRGSYQLVADANFLVAVATDQAGNNASVTNKVTLDTDAPVVKIDAPADGLITKETSVVVSGTVADASATTVTVNGWSAPVGAGGRYAATVPLPSEAANVISVVATDAASNQSTVSRSVVRDTQAPVVTIAAPAEGFITNQSTVPVSGTVTDATAVKLTANGVTLTVDASGHFAGQVPLAIEGANAIAFVATDAASNQSTMPRSIVRDTQAPVVTIATPAEGLITKETSVEVGGTVADASATTVTVNGVNVPVSDGSFAATVMLATEGANAITIVATDAATNPSTTSRSVVRDTQAPVLNVTSPADNLVTKTSTIQITGTAIDASGVAVSVNGVPVVVDAAGALTGSVTLAEGENLLTIVASDGAGNTTSQLRRVTLDTQAPVLTVNEPADGTSVTSETIVVSGTVSDATGVTVTVNGNPVPVAGGAFSTSVSLSVGPNTITIVTADGAANTSSATRSVTRTVETPPGNGSSDALPADPLVHAPPVQASIATTPFAAGAFLYSGANPLQTGVAAGTIELRRAAVLRGRVLDRDGAPIAGVEITVLDHPELGRTETRASGQYDLAVNGGGNLMLRYVKDGLLPVLRGADADWQGYVVLEDVILLGLDAQVTTVDLSGGTPAMQVARGTAQTDADGTRQATLMFPEGTTATMVLPDGSTQPLSSLHVRATEYTVGENGHRMMPAPLPATSGYTYAAELTVDEARAAGATSVRFSQPVPFYVENFLGFPVGLPVPFGVLDHARGVWVPEENGVIIGIVGKTGALADVDTNGDGAADDQATLLALGISDDERSRLAAVYLTGQTLWRIPLTHFTTVDANWPVIIKGKAPKVKLRLKATHPRTVCVKEHRSTIECQTQVLGERIGLVGTPFALHYRSDRAPGRTVENTIEIPLTDATIPDGLRGVMVTVVVAGREFVDTFPPEPNLKHTFVWDGIDAWGRRVQGGQPVTVTIGYAYDQFYAVPANTARAFGLVCRGDSVRLFEGADPFLACIIPVDSMARTVARSVGFVNQVLHTRIGTLSPGAAGLGGWTLDGHDAYDPMARVVSTGDGGRRRADAVGAVITTVAGDGCHCSSGDGGPATAASLLEPSHLATGPDGALYIADGGNNGSVRSVGSDGTIRTVASELQREPTMVVDPSGRVYVISAGQVVYRFTPGDARRELIAGAPDTINIGGGSKTLSRPVDYLQVDRPKRDGYGVTMTVASSETHGPSNVEGLGSWPDAAAPAPDLPTRGASRDSTRSGIAATDLRFVELSGMSLGPDGVLYLADRGTGYVWRVGVDGIATIFAGVGPFGDSVDAEGILAARATFHDLAGVAAAANGNVYIADGALIRKVGPDGTVTTVAGNIDGRTGADGDMGTNQLLSQIKDVTVGRDGGVYFSTYGRRIYLLRTDGRMVLVAGSGTDSNGSDDDGKLATQVGLDYIGGIAVGPDGTVYVAQPGFNQVKAISPPVAGFGRSEFAIPAEDGSSLDVFSGDGLHLRTIDALTGVVLLRFAYDRANQLTTVTDANNNLTTIVRDEGGNPTAIVGPFGQRSDLTLDADGLLSRVTNPAGEAVGLTYRAGGLLATVTNPLGRVSRFTYDSTGLLVRDQDPAGGALDLARTEFDGGWEVNQTTALGQTTTYTTRETPSGGEQSGFRTPAGLQATTVIGTDGSRTVTYPDGHVTTSQTAPDPRFGMQAPTVQSIVVTSPGGIRFEAQEARYATVSDTGSSPALITESGTAVINGRAYTSSFDLATGLQTITTPEGHQARSRIDDKGRLLMAGPPGIDSITFEYDARGQFTTTTQGDRVTRYGYDSQGLLANITDPRGDSIVVTHDAAGRVIRQLLPDGHDVRFSHDAAGNLVSLTNPRGAAYGFTNSSINMLESLTMPSIGGVTASIRYAYDADRRFSRITRPDGRTIAFEYDGTGRATSLSVPEGKVSYTYDPVTGNPATVSAPNGTLFSLGYDGGLPVTAAWTGVVAGTIQTSYNNDLRPALMSVDSGNAIDYQYNDDARLIRAGSLVITRGGPGGLPTATSLANVTTSESHSSFGELSVFTAEFSASQLYAATYTRDRLGRVIGVTESIQGESRLFSYEYDHRGRLASVSSNGTAVAVYEYDENGNRLRVTGPGGVLTGVYDARDQVSSYGGTNYIYSPNGEVVRAATQTDTTTYAYNTFGSLVSVASSGGKRVDYLLDAANRRIGKSVNGSLVQGFLYEDQLRIVAELDASNNVVSRFVYGTRPYVPDFMVKTGATYRIVSDPAGSVRLVVNAETGAVAQRIDYDEFGRITRNTNPGFQPFGFGGGLYDEDTKLIHFGAREYDAFAGRWTSQDPAAFANGNNLHTYAGNDPVNFGDPSGFDPCDCSQNLLTGIGSDLVAGVNYTLAPGVKPYFAPDFADRLNDAIRTLNGWGVVPRINDGYRTEADQEFQRERGGPLGACNPHGRDACKHQLGYSVDINVRTRVRPGYYVFNPDFGLIVAAMIISDIRWGGEFRTPDWVHFYNDAGGANAKERKARAKQLEDFFNNCLAP